MANENALTVSLEEFGLSIYEARAYVALITRGTMSASDLAFYSEIPRTKIYPTMKKLTSKNLAIISNAKSTIAYTAVQPEDAFDAIIHEQIQKVTAMNTLVADLKKAGEENRRARDSEEKRYIQIGAGSALSQLRSMIEGARSSIVIMADRWGMGLLEGCREQLIAAQKSDVTVRCIIPPDQVCSDAHRSLPSSVDTRVSQSAGNCMVFDRTEVLVLDNTNGRGAVFASASMLGAAQTAVFDGLWAASMKTDALTDMTVAEAQDIYRAIDSVGMSGLPYVLNEMAQAGKSIQGLYELLERDGIILDKKSLDDMLCMLDAIMQITCSGRAVLDASGRSIVMESPRNGDGLIPWVTILEEYLRRRGYNNIRTVHQSGSSSDGEKTHIHLGKN